MKIGFHRPSLKKSLRLRTAGIGIILLIALILTACSSSYTPDNESAPSNPTTATETTKDTAGGTTEEITELPHTHNFSTATCTTPKTCSCGVTEGEANGHTWSDATCTSAKTCSICGATDGSATGHKWSAATCTSAKTCSVCGATDGNATGHKWSAATCTSAKTCSVCGATDGNANGHTWQDATCTAPKTCTTCGKTSGNAIEHNYSNGACAFCGSTDPNYSSNTETTYVLNIKTMKFHKLTCHKLPTQNRQDTTMSRDEIINAGYSPCGLCHP